MDPETQIEKAFRITYRTTPISDKPEAVEPAAPVEPPPEKKGGKAKTNETDANETADASKEKRTVVKGITQHTVVWSKTEERGARIFFWDHPCWNRGTTAKVEVLKVEPVEPEE